MFAEENPALLPLTMLITTQAGDAYTWGEYQAMFRNAGFASNAIQMLETEHSVMISVK